MKSMFNKQQKSKPIVCSSHYRFLQQLWARKLSRWTDGLSRRTLLYLLVLFMVVSGSFFLYNIYASFEGIKAVCPNTAVISKIKTINSKK